MTSEAPAHFYLDLMAGSVVDPPLQTQPLIAAELARGGDKEAISELVTDIVSRQGGQVLFAGDDFVEATEWRLGRGAVNAASGGIQLEAAIDERLLLTWPVAGDPSLDVIVGGMIRIEEATDELVQLRLLHEAGFEEEILRFSRNQIGIGRRVRLKLPRFGVPLPFLLVIAPARIAVWLDGVLVYRGKRSRSERPTAVLLDLLPSEERPARAELVSLVAGEVSPVEGGSGWSDGDDVLLVAAAKSALATGRLEDLFNLLSLIEDFPALEDPDLEYALATAMVQLDAPVDEITWASFLRICSPTSRQRLTILRNNKRGLCLIKVRNLTVNLPVDPSQAASFKSLIFPTYGERFNVLNDVNFDINVGDVLGIIGRNGSGKTTLLRTLMGMFPISTGAIEIRGRPLLLRPGAGMREDLSGRDNIITSALYLGLSLRQAKEIVEDVIDFSELEPFIDRPYRYYSDGMRARLIFSVATALTADILMLDELLGAGDLSFQAKARTRLKDFIHRARAVVIVEHGLNFVSANATKVLLLHEGRPVYFGRRERAVDQYMLDVMSEVSHAKALPRPGGGM